ncbi:MAG: tetratricopeptide repeat protein [Gammaproteobacteria bacterium]|nr:tetratricopeptide repeat protein [Gammaproteobacteria bacterium]
MSVINQMLRDLERRRPSAPAAGQPSAPAARRWPWSVLLLGLLLGGLIVLLGQRLWLASPAAVDAKTQPAAVDAVANAPAQSPPSVLPPASPLPSTAASTVPPATEATTVPAAEPEPQAVSIPAVLLADVPADDAEAMARQQQVVLEAAEELATFADLPALPAEPKPPGKLAVTTTRLSSTELASKAAKAADEAYQQRRYQQALESYREALGFEPTRLDWRLRLAELTLASGDLEQTRLVLADGVSFHPRDVGLRLALANLLREQQKPAEALAALEGLVTSGSEAVAWYQLRGGLAQQLGQWPLARSSYEQLVVLAPTEGRHWLGLGLAADASGDSATARQAFGRALSLPGLSATSRDYLTTRLEQLGGKP